MDLKAGGPLPGWQLARAAAVALVAYAILRVMSVYTELRWMEDDNVSLYLRDGSFLWWAVGTFVGVILAVMAGAAAWRVAEALRSGQSYDDPAVVRTLRRYWSVIAVLAGLMLLQSVWGYAAVLVRRFL